MSVVCVRDRKVRERLFLIEQSVYVYIHTYLRISSRYIKANGRRKLIKGSTQIFFLYFVSQVLRQSFFGPFCCFYHFEIYVQFGAEPHNKN